MDENVTRFFKPSIDVWKFKKEEKEEKGLIKTKEKDKSIRETVKFFDWQLSFTKTCVQIAFIIFVLANIYILTLMSINFYMSNEIALLDTYINNVFSMFVDVIGGYIIKSATENSLKIVMSVFSDYVERKYHTPLIQEDNDDNYNIDEEYYEELLSKELNSADINEGVADDDGARFESGEVPYGSEFDLREVTTNEMIIDDIVSDNNKEE